MVGATGFEPVTTRTPSVCATRLRYAPTAISNQRNCNIPTDLNQFSTFGHHANQQPDKLKINHSRRRFKKSTMKFRETKPNTHLPPNALRPKHGYEDRPNKKHIPSARQDKEPNGASS